MHTNATTAGKLSVPRCVCIVILAVKSSTMKLRCSLQAVRATLRCHCCTRALQLLLLLVVCLLSVAQRSSTRAQQALACVIESGGRAVSSCSTNTNTT
jgi:hypothetical protein